ncbi:hypothetical protein ACFS07_34795 [Undibacterium arcticum]
MGRSLPLHNSLNDLAGFAAVNRISPAAFFLSYVATNTDCETRPVEGLKMKKSYLALLHSSWHLRRSHKRRTAVRDYPGHPDARNDRQMESYDHGTVMHHDYDRAKHVRHAKHLHHYVKHHHDVVHTK